MHATAVHYLYLYKRVLENLVLKFSEFIRGTLIFVNVSLFTSLKIGKMSSAVLFNNIQHYEAYLSCYFLLSPSPFRNFGSQFFHCVQTLQV
jgi:hypothetical protein